MDKNITNKSDIIFTIISGIVLAMCIIFFVMDFNAGPKKYYNKNIDKYYKQYNSTKEITDEKDLLEILNELKIDFKLESDKISTKYFDYSRGEKVELQSNDLTELFDFMIGNIDKENFKVYTKKGALFINKLKKQDDSKDLRLYNMMKMKSGICLKNDKLYYCKSFVDNYFIYVVIIFLVGVFTIIAFVAFVDSLLEYFTEKERCFINNLMDENCF